MADPYRKLSFIRVVRCFKGDICIYNLNRHKEERYGLYNLCRNKHGQRAHQGDLVCIAKLTETSTGLLGVLKIKLHFRGC